MSESLRIVAVLVLFASTAGLTVAENPPGERGALDLIQVTHDQIAAGELSLRQVRGVGLAVFTTPFNKLDGYGDGPMNISDTVSPGGRPTLQGNGTLLRVNGLDAQTCLECHAIVSNATVPATLGIAGVGGSVTNAMIMPTAMDPADLDDLDTVAGFDGRFANPPFLFGAGGVELLALEMTQDLQALRQWAVDNPGTVVQLVTKGVSFGTIVADTLGEIDTSGIEGIEEDLIVRPFGRKGEFATTRDFDIEAMQFHFGMQPVEVVGEGIDADGDGVENEISIGHLSALQIFATSLEKPRQTGLNASGSRGFGFFQEVGCADCHMPALQTNSTTLPLRFPADALDPAANVYAEIDLTKQPAKFQRNGEDGIVVPLFADLKRHDMGDGLAESFGRGDDRFNREFTTARLWGIADTAPYLHDGRATTLTEAILAHGGEAQSARDAFSALGDTARVDLLTFLRSLRTPVQRPEPPDFAPGAPSAETETDQGGGRLREERGTFLRRR